MTQDTTDYRALAERFCAAPLPASVCSDPCATMRDYPHRTGTNLLTVSEAEQVLRHVITEPVEEQDEESVRLAANLKIIGDIQEGFRHPVTVVAFRAGFLMCREIMARFVEQGGDPVTAASIRANWPPAFDTDPGAPRLFDFDELVSGGDEGPWIAKDVPASREASAYARQVMTALGMDRPA